MRWYIIQTKPNGYLVASKNLARQNFEIFAPLFKKTIKRGSRFVNKNVLFFPGYIFIGSKSSSICWKSVNATRGVSKAITLDGNYQPVSNEIIRDLKSRCDANNIISIGSEIRSGEIAKIEVGAFANFMGEIESIDDEQRVWVLIDFMKQKARARVSIEHITSVY